VPTGADCADCADQVPTAPEQLNGANGCGLVPIMLMRDDCAEPVRLRRISDDCADFGAELRGPRRLR
jgi:hypothetical protein